MAFQAQPLEPPFGGWSSLASFSRLERLRILDFGLRSDSLVGTLRQMRRLSELEILCSAWATSTIFVDSIDAAFSLTQLKSLVMEPYMDYELTVPLRTAESITAMGQLTRLALLRPLCGNSLRHLTEMIDLQIVGFDDATPNFLNDLTTMRNLTSLKIYSTSYVIQFASSALQQLKKLKTLTLWKMDVDSNLEAVTKLPNLRELGVIPQYCLTNGDRYFSNQTPFCDLRTLAVLCEWPMTESQIQIPERCMTKVREIHFVLEKYTYRGPRHSVMKSLENCLKWSALIDVFPCLRHVRFVLADAHGRPCDAYCMFSGIDLS